MSEKITSDLQELGLSVRAYNALRRVNITRIAELAQLTEEDLIRIPNIGTLILAEIKSRLSAHFLNKSTLPGDNAVTAMPGMANEGHAPEEPIANVQFAELKGSNDGLENLGLSRRVFHLLHKANISRISQLVKLSDEQILNLRGSGPTTLAEIRRQLQTYAANSEKPLPPAIDLVDAGSQSAAADPISGKSDVLSNLTANQRRAIELIYGLTDGLEQSLAEVAKELGVSRERARQLQTYSLAKIAKMRSFQDGCAALLQTMKALGGLATSDEVWANLEVLTRPGANPAGIARFLKALDISIAFYKLHDRLILILEDDSGRQQFAYLEKGCLQEIRRYDSTYQANDLLASLKRRIDYPHLLPDDFALAFLRVHPMFEKQVDGSLGLAAWVNSDSARQADAPKHQPPPKKPSVSPAPIAPPPSAHQAEKSSSSFKVFQKLTKYTSALDDWETILRSIPCHQSCLTDRPA